MPEPTPKPSAPVSEAVSGIWPYVGPEPNASPERRQVALEMARPTQEKAGAVTELSALAALAYVVVMVLRRGFEMDLSADEVVGITVFITQFGGFMLSRLRDLRWRGGLARAAKANDA